jgi:hypothetical protein
VVIATTNSPYPFQPMSFDFLAGSWDFLSFVFISGVVGVIGSERIWISDRSFRYTYIHTHTPPPCQIRIVFPNYLLGPGCTKIPPCADSCRRCCGGKEVRGKGQGRGDERGTQAPLLAALPNGRQYMMYVYACACEVWVGVDRAGGSCVGKPNANACSPR